MLGTSITCNLMSFQEQSGLNGDIEAAELTNTTAATAAAAAAVVSLRQSCVESNASSSMGG
jgi:hypothetical protein